MSGSGGERVECGVCGHAWRVTALDADRGSTWCDMCMEPRQLDGQPPVWLGRDADRSAGAAAAADSESRPASGLGLLLRAPPQIKPEPALPPSRRSAAPPPEVRAAAAASGAGGPEDREAQGYPATISHRLPGRRAAAVRIPGPILRHLTDHLGLRFERSEQGGDALVSFSGEVRPGDRVRLQVREGGQLHVVETLSEEVYARESSRQARSSLARESQPLTHIDEIRAARLRLEAWLGLTRDDRNPWALPGRLRGGSLFLSRRMLSWCQERGREGTDAPDEWLKRGFPQPEDWGQGPLEFCTRLEEHDPRPRFRSLVVSVAEYQAQEDAWKRLLQPEPEAGSVLGGGQALPAPLLALLRRLELPPPRGELSPAVSILAAWSASGSAALSRRATAMFMLTQVESETHRAALRGLGVADRQLEMLHDKWSEAGQPPRALLAMVEEDETAEALRHLAMHPEARALMDGLLERWQARQRSTAAESQTAELSQAEGQRRQALQELESLRRQSVELRRRQETEVGALEQRLKELRGQLAAVAPMVAAALPPVTLPERPASRAAVQEELAARGIAAAPGAVDRLLLATLAAPAAGAVALVADPTGRAVDALGDLLVGAGRATVPVRAEWVGEGDLLGRLSPDGLRFLPTAFTEAVRQAAAHGLAAAGAAAEDGAQARPLAPFLLHLRGVDRAEPSRYASGLLAALDGDRSIELYPRTLNERWKAELEQMRAQRAREGGRLVELEQLFSAEALGGADPRTAWRLRLPPHLVLLASLDPDSRRVLPAALLERSLVARLPGVDLATALDPAASAVEADPVAGRTRLILPALPEQPGAFAQTRARVEDGLRTLLPLLPPPSRRLGRQLGALLAEAARWEMPDDDALAAHILQIIALPRLLLRGPDDAALLTALAQKRWVSEELSGALAELSAALPR